MVNEYNFTGSSTGTTRSRKSKMAAKHQPSKMTLRAILLYAGCVQQVITKTAKFSLNLN